MRTSVVCALTLAAAALLTACSGQQGGGASSSPTPSLRNPLDFPLYQQSQILSVRAFTQKVQAQTASGDSVFAAGNGTYTGHEVVASSGAPFSDLSDWVDKIAATPPSGYASVETGGNPEEHQQAVRYGIDYAIFQKKTDATHRRGVLVIVMDPQRVTQRFGTLLGMISRYRSLPEVMRAPIDNEAKARIGMTLSEATAPESPIGAALSALNQLQSTNARGIVVVDATKR